MAAVFLLRSSPLGGLWSSERNDFFSKREVRGYLTVAEGFLKYNLTSAVNLHPLAFSYPTF